MKEIITTLKERYAGLKVSSPVRNTYILKLNGAEFTVVNETNYLTGMKFVVTYEELEFEFNKLPQLQNFLIDTLAHNNTKEEKEMIRLRKNTIVAQLRKIQKSDGEMKPLKVGFIPCKANPNSIWIQPMWFNLSSVEDFNKRINEYTYYNCNNEVGAYPHYYIED